MPITTNRRSSKSKSTRKSVGPKPLSTKSTRKPRAKAKPKNAHELAQAVLGKTVVPTTNVAVLLDCSGSMASHRHNTIKAFNELIKPIKEQAGDQNLKTSFYQFGSSTSRKFHQVDATNLNPINEQDYNPNDGSTDLNGAIMMATNDLQSLSDPNASFLLLIVTDGQNNIYNHSDNQVSKRISDLQATDRWTVVISCPDQFSKLIERSLGIPPGNIQGWNERDARGMETVQTANTVGLRQYLGNRTRGVRASNNFFEEINVGRQGVRTVTKDLEPVTPGRFKRLTVHKALNVQEFVLSKNLKFDAGRIFYSLQKPETIQHYKEIILQRRDNPDKMYGGPEVRDKLGIPYGKDGKVKPGNLGEWVVWIQSTSSNRNLIAGMEVLYDTNATVSSKGRTTW